VQTNEKGSISEAAVLAALVKAGYPVLVPWGVARYDLVIETSEGFKKVQVKTGRIKDGTLHFNAYSMTGNGRHTYSTEEVDLFGVYCPDLDRVYLVPHLGKHAPVLRIDPSMNGQEKGIRWAKDFELSFAEKGGQMTGR
jgi:hypothetical protein